MANIVISPDGQTELFDLNNMKRGCVMPTGVWLRCNFGGDTIVLGPDMVERGTVDTGSLVTGVITAQNLTDFFVITGDTNFPPATWSIYVIDQTGAITSHTVAAPGLPHDQSQTDPGVGAVKPGTQVLYYGQDNVTTVRMYDIGALSDAGVFASVSGYSAFQIAFFSNGTVLVVWRNLTVSDVGFTNLYDVDGTVLATYSTKGLIAIDSFESSFWCAVSGAMVQIRLSDGAVLQTIVGSLFGGSSGFFVAPVEMGPV